MLARIRTPRRELTPQLRQLPHALMPPRECGSTELGKIGRASADDSRSAIAALEPMLKERTRGDARDRRDRFARSSARPRRRHRLGMDELDAARHSPSGEQTQGLLFQANIHRDLEQTSSQTRIDTLISIVREWENDMPECIRTFRRVDTRASFEPRHTATVAATATRAVPRTVAGTSFPNDHIGRASSGS